jgi:xanthine dehydrogenase large subunit
LVKSSPGFIDIISIADIPGENNYGGVIKDDPIFTNKDIEFYGEPIFAVIAKNAFACKNGWK